VNIDELRIGDLFLVDGSGLISKAIEDVEYGRRKVARRYSHVAGYIGNGQLIEAEGFRKTGYAPASKYAGCADVFCNAPACQDTILKILR
jgi:cell wall-associated NlpC family hydrolase